MICDNLIQALFVLYTFVLFSINQPVHINDPVLRRLFMYSTKFSSYATSDYRLRP